jgi:hypothetical protein
LRARENGRTRRPPILVPTRGPHTDRIDDVLTSVLLYAVVPGLLDSTAVHAKDSLTTVEGEVITYGGVWSHATGDIDPFAHITRSDCYC